MEREYREINVDDVVKYLSRAFLKASIKSAGTIGNKAIRTKTRSGDFETTPMYEYQVDFCHLIDQIQRGPNYMCTKNIYLANNLIARLEAESDKK